MLFVNNAAMGDATPDSMRHAEFGGLTAADLVFPWFLLIVGIALPFSAGKSQGVAFLRRLFGRTAWLLGLGMLVDSAVNRRPSPGLGVLQLIGLAYMVGALMVRLPMWARASTAVVLLVAHHLILHFLPIPGQSVGTITEDLNAVRYLNDTVFGPVGLRGLPSVLPTAGMVLLGTVVGERLRLEPRRGRRCLELLAIGGILALVGIAWGQVLPFSKLIWSSSYLVLAAGLGLIALAGFTVADGGWNGWVWPLVAAGANPIVAYVAPILVKTLIFQVWTMPNGPLTLEKGWQAAALNAFGPVGGGWAYTVGYAAVWWGVLAYLYHRRLFLRV